MTANHRGIPVSGGCRSPPGKFTGWLAKFGLELDPDKTRRIEFGRFAGSIILG
jgi:hypothetical protein